MKDLNRVILWTAPRSISTAFERSIRQLSNGTILHEPFSQACYLGPDRPFGIREYESDNSKTFANAFGKLTADYHGTEFLFSKDMAYCASDYFQQLLYGETDFKHTFLIRHPGKAIPSMYRASLIADRWGSFNQEEVGFKEVFQLYTSVKQIDDDVIIVDADDLLRKPEEIMKAYCEATELPYDCSMTSWEAGPVSDWSVWGAGWMDEVERTSGFLKNDAKTRNATKDDEEMPNFVTDLIEKCLSNYFDMFDSRLKV